MRINTDIKNEYIHYLVNQTKFFNDFFNYIECIDNKNTKQLKYIAKNFNQYSIDIEKINDCLYFNFSKKNKDNISIMYNCSLKEIANISLKIKENNKCNNSLEVWKNSLIIKTSSMNNTFNYLTIDLDFESKQLNLINIVLNKNGDTKSIIKPQNQNYTEMFDFYYNFLKSGHSKQDILDYIDLSALVYDKKENLLINSLENPYMIGFLNRITQHDLHTRKKKSIFSFS